MSWANRIICVLCVLFIPLFQAGGALARTLEIDCDFSTFATPDGVKPVDKKFSLRFVIDTTTGKAVLVGNNGFSGVKVHIGKNGYTFIETLMTGAVQTTTVDGQGGAVHSRHSILGELLPSQYYGRCQSPGGGFK